MTCIINCIEFRLFREKCSTKFWNETDRKKKIKIKNKLDIKTTFFYTVIPLPMRVETGYCIRFY